MHSIIDKILKEAKRDYTNYIKLKEKHAYLAYFKREVTLEDVEIENNLEEILQEHPGNQQNTSDHEAGQLNKGIRRHVSMNLFLCTKYKRTGL